MKHPVVTALFVLFAVSVSHDASAQTGPCAGKAPGKYCVGEMIMTCKGDAAGTATGCGVAVGKDGKEIIGKCTSTGPNDNKATCQMGAPAGPCAGKAPGKYCVGEMIMTCKGDAAGTATGCGVAVGKDGKEIIGKCVSTGPNDNKATCQMGAPAGPCAGKAPGKYCVGEMIMTCKGDAAGTATGCGVAVGKDGKEIIGKCVSSGPNDGKATCKMGP